MISVLTAIRFTELNGCQLSLGYTYFTSRQGNILEMIT